MLLNHIKIMLRNIYKNKSYSFISIAGLVIGMTCFILIMLFVQYELSYDTFHKESDHIYRIVCQLPGEQFGMSEGVLAVTPAPLSGAVEEAFPEVESASKINSFSVSNISTSGVNTKPGRVCSADVVTSCFSLT